MGRILSPVNDISLKVLNSPGTVMGDGRGGARVGAGRKTLEVKHETPIRLAEKKIVDKLPELIDKLLAQAQAGDQKSQIYLVDRIMGKPTRRIVAEAEVTVISHARDILRSRITDRSARVGPPGGPGRPERG